MQAIISSVIPVTHTQPTRVRARSASGLRIMRSLREAETVDSAMVNVAVELATKYGWYGYYIQGTTNPLGDLVFVNMGLPREANACVPPGVAFVVRHPSHD
jgi:hypothetical protein